MEILKKCPGRADHRKETYKFVQDSKRQFWKGNTSGQKRQKKKEGIIAFWKLNSWKKKPEKKIQDPSRQENIF